MAVEQDIEVRADWLLRVQFAVPSLGALRAQWCQSAALSVDRNLVLRGQVRAADGAAVGAGTVVKAGWRHFGKNTAGTQLTEQLAEVQSQTDEQGWFALCGIADRRWVVVEALRDSTKARRDVLTDAETLVQRVDLTLAATGGTSSEAATTLGTVRVEAKEDGLTAGRRFAAGGRRLFGDSLARRGTRTVADALRGSLGVHIRLDPGGLPRAMGERGRVGDLTGVKLRSVDCPMTIIQDGVVLSTTGSLEMVAEVPEIATIDVVPGVAGQRMDATANGCGVVEITTRRR